jgi:hypothetical protein
MRQQDPCREHSRVRQYDTHLTEPTRASLRTILDRLMTGL